jgi:hypothetical protein
LLGTYGANQTNLVEIKLNGRIRSVPRHNTPQPTESCVGEKGTSIGFDRELNPLAQGFRRSSNRLLTRYQQTKKQESTPDGSPLHWIERTGGVAEPVELGIGGWRIRREGAACAETGDGGLHWTETGDRWSPPRQDRREMVGSRPPPTR